MQNMKIYKKIFYCYHSLDDPLFIIISDLNADAKEFVPRSRQSNAHRKEFSPRGQTTMDLNSIGYHKSWGIKRHGSSRNFKCVELYRANDFSDESSVLDSGDSHVIRSWPIEAADPNQSQIPEAYPVKWRINPYRLEDYKDSRSTSSEISANLGFNALELLRLAETPILQCSKDLQPETHTLWGENGAQESNLSFFPLPRELITLKEPAYVGDHRSDCIIESAELHEVSPSMDLADGLNESSRQTDKINDFQKPFTAMNEMKVMQATMNTPLHISGSKHTTDVPGETFGLEALGEVLELVDEKEQFYKHNEEVEEKPGAENIAQSECISKENFIIPTDLKSSHEKDVKASSLSESTVKNEQLKTNNHLKLTASAANQHLSSEGESTTFTSQETLETILEDLYDIDAEHPECLNASVSLHKNIHEPNLKSNINQVNKKLTGEQLRLDTCSKIVDITLSSSKEALKRSDGDFLPNFDASFIIFEIFHEAWEQIEALVLPNQNTSPNRTAEIIKLITWQKLSTCPASTPKRKAYTSNYSSPSEKIAAFKTVLKGDVEQPTTTSTPSPTGFLARMKRLSQSFHFTKQGKSEPMPKMSSNQSAKQIPKKVSVHKLKNGGWVKSITQDIRVLCLRSQVVRKPKNLTPVKSLRSL